MKKARFATGLTQDELAKKIKVQQNQISSWEKTGKIPEKHLDRLYQVVGRFEEDSSDTVVGSPLGPWLTRRRTEKELSVDELAHAAEVSGATVYNIEAGRSPNPRATTIKRLEKALNVQLPKELRTAIKQDAEVGGGIGSLTDFDPHKEEEYPDEAGVYVFYDISDRPIYVGQSKNISSRIKGHGDKFWFHSPIVNNAAAVTIKQEGLRKSVEKLLIKFLKSNAVINKHYVNRGIEEDE